MNRQKCAPDEPVCGGLKDNCACRVSITTIFNGVIPFVVTDIVKLVILNAFPPIALWSPGTMLERSCETSCLLS